LALHLARKELVRHNERLEELVEERSRELAEAYRRLLNADSAKYDFLQLIYQEIWAPGKGLVDLTRRILSVGTAATTDLAPWALQFEDSQAALFETLNNALLLAGTHSAGEDPKMHPVPWEQVLRSVVNKLTWVAQSRGLAVGVDLVETGLVAGDLDLFFQALTTVVHAALLLAAPGSILSLTNTASDTHERLVLTIRCLEPEADLDSLFAPQTRFHPSSVGKELGLAVPLAGKILRAQGGSVSLTVPQPETLVLNVDFKRY
jgi:signal transduction histidine kinase